MNYRHAFHAGNFADVLKHAVLCLIIDHLRQKPAPFRVIDTHAGRGLYRLDSDEAQRTGEWLDGIGRLMGPGAARLPTAIDPVLRPLLNQIAAINADGDVKLYPGSPSLALALMRPDDRLIANELHPEDAAALRDAIGQDARAKVLAIDGWQAVRALLPPKERRGLVLIDPPFEEAGDLDRLVMGLQDAVRRFANGIYVLWFPIKDEAAVRRFGAALSLGGYRKLLLAELHVRALAGAPKLVGTGLAILTPPFQLAGQLELLLPFLAERLAQGPGAEARVRWLANETGATPPDNGRPERGNVRRR